MHILNHARPQEGPDGVRILALRLQHLQEGPDGPQTRPMRVQTVCKWVANSATRMSI
jgi:hypothetical protein